MGASKEYFISIQEELQNVHNQVEEGELSTLDWLIKMRNAKIEAEKVLEIVKDFEDKSFDKIVAEAQEYNGIYQGFEIKSVNGRQTYSCKNIPQVQEIEAKKRELEDKFKNAFLGFQKGTVQTTEVDGVLYWIDSDGEIQPFPEYSVGKSYLIIKEKIQK